MNKEKQRGITLIALIITIIVILILVAVSVSTISQSGLFDHAKDATNKWADEQQKESELSIDDEIKKYTANNIYAALYDDGTDVTLALQNTPNFEEKNLVKIYADALGTPIDINEIDVKLQNENASINKPSNENAKYSICSNWTTTDFRNSNDAKIIKVSRNALITNLPWSNLEDLMNYNITCVDIRTRIVPKNTNYWFAELHNLIKIKNIQNIDTSKVNDMSYMFVYCSDLESLDLSNFNTSNVINMGYMFGKCTNLAKLDLSNFNTSNVTNMSYMFAGCGSLTNLDLSNFNTGNVINMTGMFHQCNNLENIDLGNFNTSNVTGMGYMFYYCNSLRNIDLNKFNTNNVTNMESMFYRCSGLTSLDLSSFNINNVIEMGSMFDRYSNLNIVYVKDEIAKTKITTSADIPSSCQVIIKESGTTI